MEKKNEVLKRKATCMYGAVVLGVGLIVMLGATGSYEVGAITSGVDYMMRFLVGFMMTTAGAYMFKQNSCFIKYWEEQEQE